MPAVTSGSDSFVQRMRHDRYVLLLTYADYRLNAAGLEKYIHDEIGLLGERGVSTLCLFPVTAKKFKRLDQYLSGFWGVLIDGELCGFYSCSGIPLMLSRLCDAGKRPLEVQIHHLLNFDLVQVRNLLAAVPVGVRLFLHDKYTICPQYDLMRNHREFCGSAPPSEHKCADCSSWTPSHLGRIRGVLAAVEERLAVVAPSHSAKAIWVRTYPDYASMVSVVPHLLKAGTQKNTYMPKEKSVPVRLAYVGTPVRHKGWEVFTRLVQALSKLKCRMDFYHFGVPGQNVPGVRSVPVSFLQDGDSAMVEAIKAADIDVVLLWSLCPETFSYTLYESLLANTMILTNTDSGNIADTVEREDLGRVFSHETQLLEYLRDARHVRRDIDKYRGRSPRIPARLDANEQIPDEVKALPGVSIHRSGGSMNRSRLVEVVYRLKYWNRKVWR